MRRRWMYFASLTKIMRDLWLYQTVLRFQRHLVRKMKREYLSREREPNYCSKLKRGKLKTKTWWKITNIRWARVLSTISRHNQSSGSLKLRKYVFTKTWKVAVTAASLSGNKYCGFHARKNPMQQYLKIVTFSDASFSKRCIYICDYVA